MVFDIVKFAKLMGVTSSPNDGEALNALRKASGMLDAENLTWNQFISQKTIVINEIVGNGAAQPAGPQNTDIREMLDACLAHVTSPSGQQFIKSLNEWYIRNGRLTDKQKDALSRWYGNL